jgi:hypothetical protein
MTRVLTGLLIMTMAAANGHAALTGEKPVHVTFGAGIGYPQIPLSQFRPPIAITGTLGIQWRLMNKWALSGSANALRTFSLGTITTEKAHLKFDMVWGSLNLEYVISGDFNRKSFLCVGSGLYRLDRQIDQETDQVKTPGLSLAFVTHTVLFKYASAFRVTWHLLFRPSDQPQILTLTLGILL